MKKFNTNIGCESFSMPSKDIIEAFEKQEVSTKIPIIVITYDSNGNIVSEYETEIEPHLEYVYVNFDVKKHDDK